MKKIKVKDNQSLLDITVQEYGTVEGAVFIAKANNISLTDDLVAGQELYIPAFENTDTKTLNYYKENNIIPSTAQIDDAFTEIIALDEDAIIDFEQQFDETFG